MSPFKGCDPKTLFWIILCFHLLFFLPQVKGQENTTDYEDYEIYYGDMPPSDMPEIETTVRTFDFPRTTTPTVEIQPTLPDLTPIIEEVDQSCCAIPSLDCSMVNQGIRRGSEDAISVPFQEAQLPLDAAQQQVDYREEGNATQQNTSTTRFRRQVSLSEQYIDQLGINLLRFESCLCQANRAPSACRMLFPPGFYTPNRNGLFDVIFNGDLIVKRFRCSFYSGNIVDCIFRSLVPYQGMSTPLVSFLINDKAELSGRQCRTCNSFFCTFDSFKRRNQGSPTPFNDDFAQCVATRSGTPLPNSRPTTTTTQRPLWTGPPLTSSQHVLGEYRESSPALSDLATITGKGILLGLGRHGGKTTLAERYDISIDSHGGLHPVLAHKDHHADHGTNGWIIALAIIVGLLLGGIIVGIIIFLILYRRRKSPKKNQRSLRGLPIVKLDVLDPSPFCGGAGENDYEYRSGVSTLSRSSGSLYATTAGSSDSMRYGGDAAPPVARVVPFPKSSRRPPKHPLPLPPGPLPRSVRPENSGHVEGSRFRGHSTSSSSPGYRRTELTIHEGSSSDSVFPTRRPEIRARNINTSTKSDASSVHIYTVTGKRPKVPPRSPKTMNNRVKHISPQHGTDVMQKPQIIPRSPKNKPRRPENASRTLSNESGNSVISFQNNVNNVFHNGVILRQHPDVVTTHSNVSNRRSNLPSVSSSKGSRDIQGFYYDVDEDADDYNDIYASIDEADEVEMEMEMEPQRKGHSRYETRICNSEEIAETSMEELGNVADQGEQYEVPVRSALLNTRPVKPARMTPVKMATTDINTMPSSIAPPVPERTRYSTSSSGSDTSQWDPKELKYSDPFHRENEYTVIRDDLVQAGLKYS